ncbi:Lactoylglutathione lyase [hydrothermal vent metagenome]|uniref:lactoylglutathione lyase n=1 Tax=hydrothermal vent metagenome TaxID=652676 RepID=A0A3B0SGL8_9ZZZZ
MSGQYRFLHTMIRVLDLEKSLDFYCQHLGMELLRKKDYPEGRFTLAFLGYGDESNHTVLELTHNWDRTEAYRMGDAFGHIAIGVTDIYKICQTLEDSGIEIPRKPGPMKHGSTVIAFVRDPDGYMIEFIER